MSKKRYCTSCSNFDITLIIDGKRCIVGFRGKDVLKKERYLDTEDKKVQKALESSDAFNVYYYKSTEFVWMEEAEEEEPKEQTFEIPLNGTEYPEVTTVGSARIFLFETFKKKCANRAEVFAVALELGIIFPNLPLE